MSYLDYTNAFVAGMDHDRGRRLQRMHAHQLAWSYEVYGGAAAAEAAGFRLPPPEQLAMHLDWPTWQLYVQQLAELLQKEDINEERSPSRQRLERLVGSLVRAIPYILPEKWVTLRHLRKPDFFSNEYLDAFARAAADNELERLKLELDSADVGCSMDAACTEEEYRNEQRVIYRIRFTPEQYAAIKEGWGVLTKECQNIVTDRRRLVADLRRHLSATGESAGLPLAECVQQLRINAQDEAAAIITWNIWLLVELTTPMQYARGLVAAKHGVWDAVLIGRIIAEAS